MLQVALPDGSQREYSHSISPGEIAAEIGPGLAKAALAAVVNDAIVGLDYRLPEDGKVRLRLLTRRDPEALGIMRHSCAHVMARAVQRLYPGVKLAFGPTIEGGFYYDFDLEHALSEDDFAAIEAEMKKIIKENDPFERVDRSLDEAVQVCRELDQSYKVEHIQTGLAEHDSVSFYTLGEFVDLCRGPHVPSAGAVGAFKLLSVAGAYWKGDHNRQQLQRLYATAFFDKKDLEAHLERIEEAKKRDHRTLGKRLELFTINPNLVGSGLILWQPKGAIIRGTLETFVKHELQQRGYQPVYTPNIGRVELFKTSGHYPYYMDSMFSPFTTKEDEEYLLKPMNCPFHIMIYKARPRSYRELPLRLAEFGTVYRNEQSGELSGMTRVRGFTQDDAHIFCSEDQVADEFRGCIEMTRLVLDCLGLTEYRVRLGFRDPTSDKYVGDPARWDQAEAALLEVCESLGIAAQVEPGEAAFYGPKMDFVVTDCIGREWQLGTVQLDYNLPEKFELEYIGGDNAPHRPAMIHRAPLGSMERFIGVLIEHFAGAFPLWLAPEQVRVLTVSEKSEEYARQVELELRRADLRVSGDYRSEKLGAKIRDAQLELIPYMFVVGPRDVEQRTVSVRDRLDGDLGALPLADALERLRKEIADRTVRKTFSGGAVLGEPLQENEY